MSTLPLMVQPPQFEDALSKLQKGMTLQQMAQAREMGQQALQKGKGEITAQDLANQEKQLGVDFMKRSMAWYQNALSGDQPAEPASTPQPTRMPALPSQASATTPAASPLAPPPNAAPGQVAPPLAPGLVPAVSPPPEAAPGQPPAAAAPPPAQSQAPAPAAAPPASPTAAPPAQPTSSVSPAINMYRNLIASASKFGMTAQTGPMAEQLQKLEAGEIDKQNKQFEATQKGAELISQLVAPIQYLPVEKRNAALQRVRPQLEKIEASIGGDPSAIPPTWDASNDSTWQQISLNGLKAENLASHMQTVATVAKNLKEGLIKNSDDLHKQTVARFANISNNDQLQDLRSAYQALAEQEKTIDPKAASLYESELKQIPVQWNAGMRLQAQLSAAKPEDRPKLIEDSLKEQARRVASAALAGPVPYAKALAEVDPEFIDLFDPADKWDKKTTADKAQHVGLTVDQATKDAISAERLGMQEQLNKVHESLLNLQGNQIQMMLGLPMGGNGNGGNGNGNGPDLTSNLSGEEFLKTIPDVSLQNELKGMAEGRLTAPSANARNATAIMKRRMLLKYDPGFSEQKAQIRKNFTTGKDAPNIRALNTATAHLDELYQAAEAMHNGTFQTGNAIYNYLATKLGSDKVTNYNYVLNALSGETASALKGTATDPEIAHVMSTMANVQSPEQALGTAKAGLNVMGDKLNTYKESYEKELGEHDANWSPVLPTAQKVFDRYQVVPGGSHDALPVFTGGATKDDIGKPYLNNGKPAEIIDVSPDGKKVKFGPIGTTKKAAPPSAPAGKPKAAVDSKYTEQQIREWAAAKNPPLDADDAVRSAREKGILA